MTFSGVCVVVLQELVSEKLSVQQQKVELERLNEELEKIGLNREKLLQQEHTLEDRYDPATSAVHFKPISDEGLTDVFECQQVQAAGVSAGGNRPADHEGQGGENLQPGKEAGRKRRPQQDAPRGAGSCEETRLRVCKVEAVRQSDIFLSRCRLVRRRPPRISSTRK